MTINSGITGAVVMGAARKLVGSDRGLDTSVGLVILAADILVGSTTILGLYEFGTSAMNSSPSSSEEIAVGFAIGLFGAIVVMSIATIVFLIRVVRRRRSWTPPFVGGILMSVVLFGGYLIMAAGL